MDQDVIIRRLERRVDELEAELRARLAEDARDAAARRRVEAELRVSETLLLAGQQLSSTGSFLWRLDDDTVTFSEELYRIFEFEPGSLVTHERINMRVHPDDRASLFKRRADIRGFSETPGPWLPIKPNDIRLTMPDGRTKFIQSKGRVVTGPDGRRDCVGCIQDVTQQRLAESALDEVRSELTHAARAMTLGVLTASIAHELNQPLAGIVANASACLRMLAASPPNVDAALETARRNIRDAHRAADVIARLRALFAKKEFAAESVDLNQSSRDVLALVAHELQRRQVVLHTELDEGLPAVVGDRVQLQQVILNLILNACDAMDGVWDRPRVVTIRTTRDESGGVTLTVRDAGVGLPREAIDRLFESFYTTKPGGMGIGLSVSRAIIERLNGKLCVSVSDDPGTAFSFSIPAAAPISAGGGSS